LPVKNNYLQTAIADSDVFTENKNGAWINSNPGWLNSKNGSNHLEMLI
jgi:hypothetical protein